MQSSYTASGRRPTGGAVAVVRASEGRQTHTHPWDGASIPGCAAGPRGCPSRLQHEPQLVITTSISHTARHPWRLLPGSAGVPRRPGVPAPANGAGDGDGVAHARTFTRARVEHLAAWRTPVHAIAEGAAITIAQTVFGRRHAACVPPQSSQSSHGSAERGRSQPHTALTTASARPDDVPHAVLVLASSTMHDRFPGRLCALVCSLAIHSHFALTS